MNTIFNTLIRCSVKSRCEAQRKSKIAVSKSPALIQSFRNRSKRLYSIDSNNSGREEIARRFWTESVATVGLNAALGIQFVHYNDINSQVTLKMEITDKHMAATGKVHGGSISTLADTAIGFGCWLRKPENASGFAVVDSSAHFLRSAAPGDVLICKATPIKQGNIVQVWDAEIFIQGKEEQLGCVASVRSTAVNTYSNGVKSQENNEKALLRKNWARLGTKFNVDKMSKAEIAARFDKHSDNWEYLVKESKYEPVFQWIFESCQDFPGRASARVLDLACGVGLVGKALRKNGFKGSFTAGDISPGMLSKAIATGFYDSLSFVHDLDYPLPSDFRSCFDLVVCTGATEMLKDPGQLLKSVSDVLAPAGQLWVTFQDSAPVDDEKEHPTAHQGMKTYSEEQIRRFAVLAGLKEVAPPSLTRAAYYLPSATGDGRLRPIPFSMWRFCK